MGRAGLYNSEYFLINSLAISKDYTNFAGMMSTAIYNKGGKIQGNVAFLASFNVLYLAVSLEKLHTHTHTQTTFFPTRARRTKQPTPRFPSSDREQRVVPICKQQINKYIHQTSPVLISLSNSLPFPLERNRERGF